MAYSIRLPDGTLVRNIPDELSPEEAKARIIKAYPQYAPPSSTLRQAADIPVQVGRGAVMGVRMLSDALGADNPVSQALRGAEDYLGDLLSAQAKKDQQEIARIMKDAEDKGILDQVKAGIEALTVAPVDLISQVLGTAAPTIVAGVAGAAAKLGAVGIGTLQAGTGAAMGAGLTKGNIYEVVKEELMAAKVPENIAEERAKAAQNYTGENWDQIILGGALGGAAALGPLERIFARLPAISPQVAAKNIFVRSATAGLAEAAPETAQAFQEQVAQNIALQREGFDVPTFRGAVANATLEGLAGFGIGAPIGALEGKPQAKQPPGQQETEPTPPPAGVPPGAVIPEEEALTPEEEAEFQARLAAAPPAAPVAVQPQPQPPLPPAPAAVQPPVTPPPPPTPVEQVVEEEEVIEVPPTVEQIAQQAPATPQTKSLTDQLAQVRAARMDPMLTPEDPAFQELDRREQEILGQIQQLSVQPGQLAPSVQAGQLPPPVEPSVQVGQLPQPSFGDIFTEPVTPTGQTVEDQIRAQKAEERRERQAAQEAKKGEFVLQNRDRSSTASLEQMEKIASEPDYGRAGFSRTPDGAPIIAYGDFAPEQLGREDVVTTARGRKIPIQYAVVEADEVITSNDMRGTPDTRYGNKEVPGPRAIAGNGRITGLQEAFNRGTATPYVEQMEGDASLHGVSPDVIAGMKKPILVRVMPQEGLTRDIGDELNMSSMLELSPVEQARNDLNRVDLEALEFGEDGEVTNASLGQFINAQPIEERAKLVDRGLPTKQARQRLENAIFAQAYNDDDLIAMFAQTDDPEAKLVVNALAQVAPQMAQLEGAGDLDIRDIVTDAAKIIISGKRRGLKMREIATQVDMTVDPDTRIIVELFAANPRSNKGAIEALRNAATTAYNESLRPEEGLFGVEPKMERREIVERMRRGDEPTRTEDVAAAQRPGPAPSDVERQAEPSPAAVPPQDQGFELRGQTPEELAELQRRELSGEAEAERDRIEAEEAARAAAEAERKIADRKRETFELAPPPSAPTVRAAAPSGDLFGTAGITEQPTRAPRRLGAEPSPIEAAIEESVAKEAMGTPQEALDDLIKFLRLESPKTYVTYDPNEKTIVTEEMYSGETTIKRIQFDAVASLAKKKDGRRGAYYTMLLKDTPTESAVLTFEPMGLKPLDRTVGIKYALSESKKDVNVPPVEEEIANRMKQLGVDNLEKRSKEVQDFYGVSKPVADAYVRAVRKQAEAIAKISYGQAPSSDFQDAYNEAQKLLNRITGISKRKKVKEDKKEERSEVENQRSTLERLLPKTAGDWVLEKITPYAGNWRVSYTTTNASGMVSGSSMPVEATELVGKTDDEIKSTLSERARKNGLKGVADAIKKPSTKTTRKIAEGTVVERIELPENLEIRIVKLKDGYSVYQYDLDADQIVMGEQRQFRAPAFPKDQDAYRAAEAFADEMFDKVVPKVPPEKMKAAMQERLSRGEDVINNKTPDPDIPADQRLVLMSCCATKNKAMGMGPAMDVYTGVFFQTFKNKVKEGAMPNVRILSAKYGFIKPDQRIGIYDQVMDKATADQFMLDDKLVEGFPSNIKDVLIVGSDQYQRVMKAAVEDLIKAGKIDKGASINVTKGGIGEQRAQLGKYLSSLKPKPKPTPGTAEASESIGRAYDAVSGMLYRRSYATTLDNQHRTRLINALKDQGYTATDAKDIVEEAVRIKAARNMPMDFLQARDLQEAGRVLNLQDVPGKEKPKPEKFAMRVIKKIPTPANQVIEVIEVSDTEHTVRVWDNKLDRVDRTYFEKFKGDDSKEKALAFAEEVSEKLSPKAEPVKTPREFYMEMIPAAGFKRLDPNDPRRYKNKAGEEFLTFERDGVRIAVKGNTILFAADRGVGMYMGEGTDLLLQAMIVDEGARQQGRATKAMRDILEMADQAGMTTYIEPVQMTKDVGMTTDQLKAFYKRFGFEPQKAADWTEPKQPPTDRVMVREPGAKIEAAPAKAEPAKFGPTITEIMAETEALRKKAAEMGIETTYVPKPDTSKREAREKKEREDIQRLASERIRLEKLTKEPIKGTPEQRSAAERLARSVNGELLFLDGSRGLGIVFGKDRNGEDAYLPIYEGKISRVDVRDFTGLKTTDKEYLKQVRSELMREAGARQKRKDEEAGWEFMIEMTPKKQGDLFGSPTEAKEIGKAMTEVKGKKLPPGRSPELTAAAQAVRDGKLSAAEYNKLVDTYKPIPLYAEPLKPATSEQVFDALDVKKREQINPEIPNGTKVGLRLDIPAFNRKGIFVVSIHQKRTASAPGKVIGYGSVAKAKNVTFGVGNQLKALEIAAGSAKDALQTIEGEYVNVSPEQAFAEAQRAIKDPNYVQVGIDPTRHAYFYDRRTTLPVVSAEEVIQIGNMILAKKPTFGSKADFLYNIEGAPTQDVSQDATKRENEIRESTKDLKDIRREKVELEPKTTAYGTTEEGQRIIASLNALGNEMSMDLDKQKPEAYTADNLMRQARRELDNGNLSPEVFGVLQSMYMADPKLLEGLRFEVTQKYSPEEIAQRRANGQPIPMGAFKAADRLIHLYTGTKGVTDPLTIRHELTHTLEQMMTPQQRKAVINAYIADLKKAAKKHKDARSQEFFDKVIKFLNEPFPANRNAMTNAMPSMDFYQFTSPSEYWAVNAEKLMSSRLGTPWDRFKRTIRKMFEKMKGIFGFNNRFVVHDVFDKIMSGSKERMDRRMLMSFIQSSGGTYDFFENIEQETNLMIKSGRADTPMLDHAPAKRLLFKGVQMAKDEYRFMVENPSSALGMFFNSVNRGISHLRNKFVWFGTGLNEADRIRYNGEIRTANGEATASLALDNMIRGGNISTQVLFLGGLEYNPKTLQYTAVRKEKNMTKAYEAEARLKEKLGDQLGTNIFNAYGEAKRSLSMKNEVVDRKKDYEQAEQELDDAEAIFEQMKKDPNVTEEEIEKFNRELRKLFIKYRDSRKSYFDMVKLVEEKVTMPEDQIKEFIALENKHPELKEILDNFNAVNQNLLRVWRDVGLISEGRYKVLSSIKDYVPWYRIMNDDADIHDPVQSTTRTATNIGREKLFRSGTPSVTSDFIIEEEQKSFRVPPGRVNTVKLGNTRLSPNQYEVTPQGELTLKVDYQPGQVLVVETQREIENMIDNMTRNIMRMSMNAMRQHAANRIVSEYAMRDANGRIMTFKKADVDKGRMDYIKDGRRTVIEIPDPLIAQAMLGMETVGMDMVWEPLAAAANFTRRTITLSPVFQLKQVFKDAPTAALVTGVKNPGALIGGVYKGFIDAVRDTDPAGGILRQAGIGGFYSPARTPEADVKRQIGIINNNTFDYVMKALDHWGDSSDMAQRIAIYNRVMKETGDEALAMYQASNVINFLRHGSGSVAIALTRTVPFLNAYAQSIDVLYNALVGGGLRGMDRTKALRRLAFTGSLMAGTVILYTMLVGDDDDYQKLDDQTKVRNIIIPGTDVILPMNTSAAFFFKAIPELITNKIINEGTKNEVDAARLRTALKESAIDLLLGPTPVPSVAKPFIEISLDYNFFTSRPITPRGMENLDAYQQYDMRTSEAAKLLSGLTGTEANRLLNPMEADHLVRSIFGTAGAMVAWSSNVIGEGAAYRPEMTIKEFPVVGAFLRPEVPRGREDLFYRLKDATDRKYNTYMRLVERGDDAEADRYFKRHPNLISYYEYTTQMANDLKDINSVIRFIAEIKDPSYSAERKRAEIQELMVLKQDVLEGIEQFRKEAYAD